MNYSNLFTFSLFAFSTLIYSCGPSEQEIKQREQAVRDSMNTVLKQKEREQFIKDSMNTVLDSIKNSKTVLTRNVNSIEEGTNGTLNYDNIKITYDYDDKFLNKESDIDGKITNGSTKSFKNFELMVSCYDSDKQLLKSFTHTVKIVLTPGKSEAYSIHFTDAKKTKSVKVKLLRAQEI